MTGDPILVAIEDVRNHPGMVPLIVYLPIGEGATIHSTVYLSQEDALHFISNIHKTLASISQRMRYENDARRNGVPDQEVGTDSA